MLLVVCDCYLVCLLLQIMFPSGLKLLLVYLSACLYLPGLNVSWLSLSLICFNCLNFNVLNFDVLSFDVLNFN
jgi:hypothetical protein